MRTVVVRMGDAFDSRGLNGVRWIKDVENVVDALTKCNPVLSQRLNMILGSGIWDDNIEAGGNDLSCSVVNRS